MAEKVSAKTAWALAKAIKGAASSPGGSSTQTATFIRKDTDGTCWVRFAGNDFDTPVNGQTLADAEPGQTVQCSIDGTNLTMVGNASDPAVGVTRMTKAVGNVLNALESAKASLTKASENAQKVADAAQAVADAVNQHFFSDANGVHVTEATQEDWNTNHSGANVLINSIGQLFRDGLNNLLTLTTENGARALTVWDGLGNTADHIRAIIGETIQLGNDAEKHVTIDSDSVDLMDGTTALATFGANETHLGLAGSGTLYMADDKCSLYSENWTFDGADRQNTTLSTSTTMPSDEDAGSSTTLSFAHSVEDEIYDPAYGENWSEVSIEAYSGYSESHSEAMVTLTANYAKSSAHVAADDIYLQGRVHRDTSTVTATTANATIINGVNHCWTNNATTTITVGVNLRSSLANQNLVQVATAPSGYRPPYTVVGSVYVTGQVVNLQAWIDANGAISVNNRSGTSVTTSANIYISFTFAP